MPNIAIDDDINVTQIRAQWTMRYGIGESSWSFITLRAAGDVRADVRDAWEAWLMPHFIAGRHDAWLLERVIAEDRWPAVYPALVDLVNLGPDPPGVGNGMPPQCTSVISWRSGDTGRANRGRTYMGPYAVDSCDSSDVIGPGDAATSAFAEAMMLHFTDVLPGSPLFAIVSRISSPPLAPHGTYDPVTTYYYPGRWGVQRRRLDWDWRT